MNGQVRHLYVHLPFCAHRCGYCDFVTVVGREELHARYVDAVLAELELERGLLARPLQTIFLGGGTPTFTDGLSYGGCSSHCRQRRRSRSRRIRRR